MEATMFINVRTKESTHTSKTPSTPREALRSVLVYLVPWWYMFHLVL
jgi:hypothetical protein